METDAIHELTAAYALDALDEAEVREYEDHLARCPRCRDELASLGEAAAALAYAADAPAPPPALRTRILEQAPSGKVYEAWVVQHGTPKRAGTFRGGQTATLLTTPVPAGAKVLVTQERAPGVDAPKGTPLTGTQA